MGKYLDVKTIVGVLVAMLIFTMVIVPMMKPKAAEVVVPDPADPDMPEGGRMR